MYQLRTTTFAGRHWIPSRLQGRSDARSQTLLVLPKTDIDGVWDWRDLLRSKRIAWKMPWHWHDRPCGPSPTKSPKPQSVAMVLKCGKYGNHVFFILSFLTMKDFHCNEGLSAESTLPICPFALRIPGDGRCFMWPPITGWRLGFQWEVQCSFQRFLVHRTQPSQFTWPGAVCDDVST